MDMKTAQYQYAQKVKVNWHEAECGVSDAVIIGITMDGMYGDDKPPLYEVKTLDDAGRLEPGSITDVDEDMISLC